MRRVSALAAADMPTVIIVIIIIIIIMKKTEAGLRGLCVREIDIKIIINTCSQNTTVNYGS